MVQGAKDARGGARGERDSGMPSDGVRRLQLVGPKALASCGSRGVCGNVARVCVQRRIALWGCVARRMHRCPCRWRWHAGVVAGSLLAPQAW
eukprot:5014028-Prorocentrum_lima.AAC.1